MARGVDSDSSLFSLHIWLGKGIREEWKNSEMFHNDLACNSMVYLEGSHDVIDLKIIFKKMLIKNNVKFIAH
jgi:hypothetical protein